MDERAEGVQVSELRHCPFCGGEMWVRRVTYPSGEQAWSVMPDAFIGGCYVCSNIPHVDDEDWREFVTAWNRRAE